MLARFTACSIGAGAHGGGQGAAREGAAQPARGIPPTPQSPGPGRLCGSALAHAKSGDPAAIAGYLGNSDGRDDAVARFRATYPEQTDRDYDVLVKAALKRRIRVARVAA